ncbi:MAG TPA: hypothetical protein VHD87_02725 [Acidimicrobiales bacterium]|nr:hypothetical protein [Acidimicrobiales bacterium]
MAHGAVSGRRSGVAGRAALAAAALILLGAASWFAASWIDTGDSTCGAVIHPHLWLGHTSPGGCQRLMLVRTAITAASIAAAGALLFVAARRRPTTPKRAAITLTVVAITSAALLLINELVRSVGAF